MKVPPRGHFWFCLLPGPQLENKNASSGKLCSTNKLKLSTQVLSETERQEGKTNATQKNTIG